MASPILGDYDPGAFFCEITRGGANEPVRERLAGL